MRKKHSSYKLLKCLKWNILMKFSNFLRDICFSWRIGKLSFWNFLKLIICQLNRGRQPQFAIVGGFHLIQFENLFAQKKKLQKTKLNKKTFESCFYFVRRKYISSDKTLPNDILKIKRCTFTHSLHFICTLWMGLIS